MAIANSRHSFYLYLYTILRPKGNDGQIPSSGVFSKTKGHTTNHVSKHDQLAE